MRPYQIRHGTSNRLCAMHAHGGASRRDARTAASNRSSATQQAQKGDTASDGELSSSESPGLGELGPIGMTVGGGQVRYSNVARLEQGRLNSF